MNSIEVQRIASVNRSIMIPAGVEGHQKHRLEYFVCWLDERGQVWINPDLAAYRDHLMSETRLVPGKGGVLKPSPLSPASAQAHLSTIRGRYKAILESNSIRDQLYAYVPKEASYGEISAADLKAMVDELLIRLENATKPRTAKVEIIKSQDRIDADHLRLTKTQAKALIDAPKHHPDNTHLQVLRDTAMIALMICTGVREMELCGLNVADLRQYSGGELVLHVRRGKGAKERTIPYGELSWSLALVEKWLAAAGIESGPVFRGFYKNGKSLRSGRLTLRAVNQVMDRYPIAIDGVQHMVNPSDCRRTYAYLLYMAGVDPYKLMKNLGHSDLKTTLGYIGDLTMKDRCPPDIFGGEAIG